MAENSVTSASAAESVVTPAVEGLAAKAAARVGIPNWHAALHGSTEERGRDMGVGRGRSSSEPGTSTGGAAGIEVRRRARDGRIMKQRGNGEGLDLAREGPLGGAVRASSVAVRQLPSSRSRQEERLAM